jgi:hypothetical protein
MLASLRSQHSFCLITVPLAFAVFFIGVLDGNLFVH